MSMTEPGSGFQDSMALRAEGFVLENIPTVDVDRREASLVPLADAVRDLVDATIRTTVDNEELDAVREGVAELVNRLRASQLPGPAGVRFNSESRAWNWGNAVVGLGNAVAPPLQTVHDPSGLVHAEVNLGAAYEGPPGLVHGGVTAMLLDHLMGETASGPSQRVIFTGTLTTRYLRGTPLGKVRLEARIDREERRKVFVVATVSDAEGVTVEAEGVFIQPSWAAPDELC
ncbi:PaaI family thioesterase [Aldersonia kunmingensis]|uniref:PaaI family thioesterase n=1 Tax=Aldersonia kunmingensis TaxID=408066 RepID=UPI000B224979|nr:PaaI family thioesterase [Aldersonia kunmingensis]